MDVNKGVELEQHNSTSESEIDAMAYMTDHLDKYGNPLYESDSDSEEEEEDMHDPAFYLGFMDHRGSDSSPEPIVEEDYEARKPLALMDDRDLWDYEESEGAKIPELPYNYRYHHFGGKRKRNAVEMEEDENDLCNSLATFIKIAKTTEASEISDAKLST